MVAKRKDPPPPDLDLTDEPEPDWAAEIRRGRMQRGERLKELLGDEPAPQPTITPPPVREDAPRLEPPNPPRPPDLRVIASVEEDEATEVRPESRLSSGVRPTPPPAVAAEGVWINDADGKRYLDGAGGAIVVNVGHGDRSVIEAMTAQVERTQFVHGTMFTTDAVESYAADLAPLLPMDDARDLPGVRRERGRGDRAEDGARVPFGSRRGSQRRDRAARLVPRQHARGARRRWEGAAPKRRTTPWLGRFPHVPPAYEYRCENPDTLPAAAPGTRVSSTGRSSEPVPRPSRRSSPSPSAARRSPRPCRRDDYWPAILEVCRRHGVLVIADEVMTGFGRTGRWFGGDHWDVRPDILTAGKGSTCGYLPFGFAAAPATCSRPCSQTGFVHGFTWSHNGVGAAVAHAPRAPRETASSRRRGSGRALLKISRRRSRTRRPWATSAGSG